MLRKGYWIGLSAILIVGLLLTACAPKTVTVTVEVPVERTVEVPVERTVEVTVPAPKGAITVLGVWGGDERVAFQDAVAPFSEQTGIGVAFEGTRDLAAVLTTRVEAGNPPDIAILPNPGQLYELAEAGHLVPLDSFLDVNQIAADYGQSWVDLASYDGHLYGIFYKVAIKSLVWYNPKAFEAAGYEVPTTWDELIALSDQIVADGGTPWCIGLESGPASGWPGTDWIEDIMLRTAGPEVYDQWVRHEIPWTDPAVKTAWETFGQIVRNDDYVWGGTTGALSTNFGDSPAPMFDDPPGCYMHRQASFITGFFPEGLVAGEDYDFFPLPPIDPQWGTPALIAGDVVVMLNDTPEVRQFVEYLAGPEPQEIWAGLGGFISANKNVSLDAYPDDLTRKMAQAITTAEVARFDGSDLMPAAVGAGSFWSGVLDYVGGTDLDTVLEEIEATAVDAYGQ
ncbi:MAG TPA: carbohydrate ABC transporter substrate-binding protein [Thermoflexia bacterium]|jgi:alpha-glucoside transport system substrate-binding protein|nr:carbohydrate ABC transporter substrate-binding protein [Thermoflexia bacterium]